MENSILLHSGNQFHPNLSLFALRPKKLSLIHGSSREQMWRIKRVKATGENSGEAASADESNDALQVTIEKSKKVLAMQQDLLQQIAERRKVVSSIKSSLANAKGTYDGGSGSLSDVDIPDVDKDYNVTVPSTAATPITDVDKNTPPAISHDFVESKREIKRDLADERAPPLSRSSITASSQISSTVSSKRTLNVPPETPKSSQETLLDVNSHKSLVDVPGKKIQSYMPSLHKESSASHVEQRNENLEGSSAEANEETEDPVNIDEKPPPLAGTNVMNIILVASECAPWSKTGTAKE